MSFPLEVSRGRGDEIWLTVYTVKFGFVGVAPNATIMHYKVFPCSGSVTTDVGVNASLAAYESGVDVINASIGGQGGWGSGERDSTPSTQYVR